MCSPYPSVLLLAHIVSLNSPIFEADHELMWVIWTKAEGGDRRRVLEVFSIDWITITQIPHFSLAFGTTRD
jgi:hypothetical protein